MGIYGDRKHGESAMSRELMMGLIAYTVYKPSNHREWLSVPLLQIKSQRAPLWGFCVKAAVVYEGWNKGKTRT